MANLLANMEATDDTYKNFISVKVDDVHVLFTGGQKKSVYAGGGLN